MAKLTEGQPAVPVLATKLRRPSTPLLLIERPRLLDQLSAHGNRRLILISAPAGYGKTALVSHWLGTVGTPYAWLSLDEQDNELATFVLYLAAAVRGPCPGALDEVEQLLRAPALLPPVRLADAILQGLAGLPGSLILALDDYHVIRSAEVHALMARLIEHLPLHIHLLLITRADPPLPLDRLRGRQELGETRAADLRFTADEARLLLQQMLEPGIGDETLTILEESTEGWAVGLHLAGLSLRNWQQRSDGDPVVFARKIAEHGHQSVTEYLLSEVLGGLPQAQADRLLQISLFDRFCASLVDATQTAGGSQLSGDTFLREIRRANLFVVSLDDEGTWFRYHHFFRALLRARLGQRFSAAEISATHVRAAAWFRGQGFVDEAVGHLLKAGEPVAAARVVEEQVHPALDREDWRQIEHWMVLIPADVAATRPRLLLAEGWLHLIRWQFGALEARVEAAESILREAPAAKSGEAMMRGEINVLRSALAQNKGDCRLTVQLSEAGMAALQPQTGYAIGQGYFNYIWGLQTSGEHERAVAFARRQLDSSGWQAHGLNLRVLLGLANICYETADLPGVQDLLPAWQKVVAPRGVRLSVAWLLFAEAWLHYQRNELAAADEAFHRLAGAAWSAHGRAVLDGHTGLVLTALARGRAGEAADHVRDLNERLLERRMLSLASVAQSLEQRIALAGGSPGRLDWHPDPGSGAVPPDLWEQPVLTHVRTLVAAGSPDSLATASELLAYARARAADRNSRRRLIEIGGLQALVFAGQGCEAEALAALQQAVEWAAPGGTLRLLADCGPGLIPLLCKLQAAGVAPDYIEKLLGACQPPLGGEPAILPPTPPTPAPVQPAPADTLTNRQIDILILLADRLSDKEIAERLVLSPVTVKKHTQRIYEKLGVHSRRAAVAEARRLGLI